jgi:hypothetical protein
VLAVRPTIAEMQRIDVSSRYSGDYMSQRIPAQTADRLAIEIGLIGRSQTVPSWAQTATPDDALAEKWAVWAKVLRASCRC